MARSRTSILALAIVLGGSQAAADVVLLEFTSPACGPCQAMRPVMQQVAAAGYAIREVDVSRHREAAAQYGVVEVPTFIVLIDGKEGARWSGGGKSAAQLIGMIQEATRRAGAAAPIVFTENSPTPLGVVGAAPVFRGSQRDRVVPVDGKPPVAARSLAAASPSQPTDAARLIAATVRLSVEDAGGKSTGTGTIVDARDGKALVLTCGHIFRESQGRGTITLSLFQAGANGAELSGTAEGALIDYDLDRDLALVCFVPDGSTTVAPVAPVDTPLAPNLPATSVGCEHGANPTAWATHITAIDRYQGHPNIEAARAPVEGRSGGGLFNAAGQLIGVCNAADPQGNEGLYAGLASVHQKLDALGLSFVHEAPATDGAAALAAAAPLASASDSSLKAESGGLASGVEVRGQDPAPTPNPLPAAFAAATRNPFQQKAPADTAPTTAGSSPAAASVGQPTAAAPAQPDAVGSPSIAATGAPAPSMAAPTALAAEERAALAEIARRGADAEVICIITPRIAGAPSEVIKVDRSSPAFLQALRGSAAATAALPSRVAGPLSR